MKFKILKIFLLINHRHDKILKLIFPILYIKELPHEILSKFFVRAYTLATNLYSEMNKALMKKEGKDYNTFIKVLFEGISNKSLLISEDDVLYRGTKMTKNEIDEIIRLNEKWKNNNNSNNNLPSFLLYSRCFLSFSKDINQIKNFIGTTDEKFYGILFILKNNKNIINNFSSNADIESLSYFPNEKEVLFFPYTAFALQSITPGNYSNKNCVIINLDYLGKYEFIFDNIKKNENFQQNYINIFNTQNYAKELVKSTLLQRENEEIKEKQIFKKIKNKILEKYDINLNEEVNEEAMSENNMIVININENIKVEKKEEKEEIIVNDELINNIKNKSKEIEQENSIKENQNKFYLTSFKLNKMNYIYNGYYNEKNLKNGIGEEYDFDNNIIFKGEYENNKRKKGIEFYIIGSKKFEGKYKDGKKWDGYLYDINSDIKYELKSGNSNSLIKEFYENGCLYNEGELKDGNKNGEGKIYDESGHLIYEGQLTNNIFNGKGKLYNYSGNLIFEGEFKNGKQIKGNKYKYNDQCELIYQKFENNLIKFEILNSYKDCIMINYGVWIMEKKEII